MSQKLLPDYHPLLRNSAIFGSIASLLIYLSASQGIAGFVGLLIELGKRVLHHHGWEA